MLKRPLHPPHLNHAHPLRLHLKHHPNPPMRLNPHPFPIPLNPSNFTLNQQLHILNLDVLDEGIIKGKYYDYWLGKVGKATVTLDLEGGGGGAVMAVG